VALRGRPPKPIEERRRLGNPGKRPLPAPVTVLPPVRSAGAIPRYRSGRAWLQAVLDAGAQRWVGPTDVAALELARQLWDDRERVRRLWQTEPTNDQYRRAYEATTRQLAQLLAQLGLDPTSRARLGVAEVRAATKLEELRALQQARAGASRSTRAG
jgi:hypothetical protein